MPWPISTIGMTSVTTFCRSIRMKAFGAHAVDLVGCAHAGRSASGSAKLITSPPPPSTPTFRNVRRSRLTECERSDMSLTPADVLATSDRRAVNGGPNALIRAASADIAAHRGIEVGIAWLRGVGQQRRGRHDLTRLAIAALDDLEVEPRLPQRMPDRRLADRLNGGDGFVADGVDPRDARARRYAVDVHGTRAAQGDAASELGAAHAEHIPEHPEQRRVAVDVSAVRGPIDSDLEGHLAGSCCRISRRLHRSVPFVDPLSELGGVRVRRILPDEMSAIEERLTAMGQQVRKQLAVRWRDDWV